MKFKNFSSKLDGMRAAKRFHVCLDCRHHQPTIYKNCPVCGSTNRQYFVSKVEFERGMQLLVLLAAAKIERLQFQHKFDLNVNSRKICAYVADASYYEGGQFVVEDSKPIRFMDKTAEIKIKLFEAIHGITVRIPQRKSGNRSAAKKPTLI